MNWVPVRFSGFFALASAAFALLMIAAGWTGADFGFRGLSGSSIGSSGSL